MIGLFFIGMGAILIASVIGWFIVNNYVLKNKNELPKFDDLD
tara:strand:- start:220 stop:345 length:126 start_codon:yes stop_codon:yes gene_type:complete